MSSAITSLLLCPSNQCFSFGSRIPTSGYSNAVTRKQHVVLCSIVRSQQNASEDAVECIGTRRRDAMLQMAFSAFLSATTLSISSPAHSLEDVPAGEFRLFSDDVNKYNISIPQDWEVGSGESDGFKSITAFYPDNDSAVSNVSVAITGIGADFTKLESFGKVDEFAESLVNGLDRSWQNPPGLAAKLIDSKAKNGLYYVEYTLQNPGDTKRHIYSVIGMANNGWYNRLYTVTGQFVEAEADKYSSKIQQAVKSFRLN